MSTVATVPFVTECCVETVVANASDRFARFRRDLEAVYPAAAHVSTSVPQHLSERFLSDLKTVAASATLTSSPTALGWNFDVSALRTLGRFFDEWRERTRRTLRSLSVPVDSPLRCRISLFRTMDLGRLERAHTNTLAWLLNPDGEHEFDGRLVKALLCHLAGPRNGVEVSKVQSEFRVPTRHGTGPGRIDVVARGSWIDDSGERTPSLLAIEAKIGAAEGEDQLADYDDWIEGERERDPALHILRVFLTPDGRDAETGLQAGAWRALSFWELARLFQAVLKDVQGTSGYHFLRFYLSGVLHDICRCPPVTKDWPATCGDPYTVLKFLAPPEENAGGSS